MRKRSLLALVLCLALAAALAVPAAAAGAEDFAKGVDSLPRLETVKNLSKTEQQALYAVIDDLWENVFYKQSEADQKALEALPQYETLTALTAYLNEAQISTPNWIACGQLNVSGDDLKDGVDYYYDAEACELVITGTKPVVITLAKADAPSTDVLRTIGEAEVTLKDVTIQAPAEKSAITAENGLKLTLVGSSSLTAQDHAAISGAEGITVSGTGSLTVLGGTGADGIGAKGLTVTGGTLTITGGDGTPGTEELAGGDGGRAVGTDTMTVTGGSLKLTGGKAGTDGGQGTGKDGKETACTPVEDQRPLAETKVQLTDEAGKAVAGKAVEALALSPDLSYGLTGVVTDGEGQIYLYLPEDTLTTAVSDGVQTYTGSPIASGESGVLTLAANNPNPPVEPTTAPSSEAPTTQPTEPPAEAPTTQPTEPPTEAPTTKPTEPPTEAPATKPTERAKDTQSAPKKPEVESQTGTSVTLKAVKGTGETYYAYGSTKERPDTNWVTTRTFVDLTPGKTYYFFAYFGGDDATEPSAVSEPLEVTLTASFSGDQVKVQGVQKTYDGKSTAVSYTIPDGAVIRFREGDSGDYTLESSPSYTNAGTYRVGYQVTGNGYNTITGSVTIQISKAVPVVTLADQSYKHDGNTHPMGGARVSGISGQTYRGSVTYTYYTDEALTKGKTTVPPSAVGTYYVQASVPESTNYTAAESSAAKLVIEKSGSTTTTKPSTGGNTGTNTGGSTTGTTGKTYTVTATAGAGGTISQSGKVTVQSGKSVSFTVIADKNYEVEDVKVDGKSMGSVGVYTFTDVKADHTIEATFRRTVAETTAPTIAPTTAPTTAPTETVPATTEEVTKPVKKHKVPIIVPILLVILAGGAIGGAVYVYKKFGSEEE